MSNEKEMVIGIIGAGNISKGHINSFQDVTGSRLKGITDINLPAAEARAKEFGVNLVYPDIDAMLADPELDAVVVAVPNKFHAPITIQAMHAGKHVLLEKPMAIHAEDAADIVKVQRETGKIVMVSHQMRWQWAYMKVREQVEKGTLGHIYSAKTTWFRRKGIPGWGTWFTQMGVSGGGPLIDIGVHMLDVTLHMMGNPKPVSVSGATFAEFGPKRKGIGNWGTPDWSGTFDVEDLATAMIRMDNGSVLTLDVSWAVHMDTSHSPSIHLMGSEGGASLYGGEKGYFLSENFDQPIDLEISTPDGDEGARERLSLHFLECIREGKQPISDVVSGYTNNLILQGIYESSRTGKEVILDWKI